MKFTIIPKAGLKISIVGLGFWQIGSYLWNGRKIDVGLVKEIVKNSYEQGINFYDTAEIYGWGRSEKLLGIAIKELGIRDNIIIVSKIAGFRHNLNDMFKAAKNIVQRLGSSPDVMLHHWPPPFYVNICKVVQNLERIVEQGLAHYYGLSNYGEGFLEKALSCTRKHEPVLNQLHYNLGYRVIENNLVEILNKEKIAIIAWSPLAKGALAGLRKPTTITQKTDKVFNTLIKDEQLQYKLRELSKKYGVEQSSLSLAWIISHNIVPIPGTRRPERVRDYALAGDLFLLHNNVKELDRLTEKYKYLWGKRYNSLRKQRFVPGIFQKIAISLTGGI